MIIKQAKLVFNYGTMGSGKTAGLLITAFNIEQKGGRILMVKPDLDTRSGQCMIASRIDGLKKEALNFSELCKQDLTGLSYIFVDEAQFLSYDQAAYLAEIVDEYNINVYCYGLRTDFQGQLFEGSKALFELADEFESIDNLCWCGDDATHNARIGKGGKVIKTGEQVLLGGDDYYTALCRKHWKQGVLQNA